METLKEKIDRLGKSLNVEVLTNNFTAPYALYGLSDEIRKEIISLLAHWTLHAEEKVAGKYRYLARSEMKGYEDDQPIYVDPYEYMMSHNVDYYGEIEEEVERMWQRRVKLDEEMSYEEDKSRPIQ